MFDGWLQVGGVEVVNNERTRGYAATTSCPFNFKDDPCETLEPALEALAEEAGDPPPGAYTYDAISDSPWHDNTSPEASDRFLGLFATSIKGIYSSTRTAPVTQGITDGGTIGMQRRTTRDVRVNGILLAQGRDALEYGTRWLDAALDADACGRHGEQCGTTDMQYLTACPPSSIEFEGIHYDESDPPVLVPDFEDPRSAWVEAINREIRYLHNVAAVSGPNEGAETDLGNDWWMLEVEFVLTAGRPYVYSVTKPVVLPTTPSTVIDDIPKNLIPYPSAELSAAAAVVVATNYSTNPSVETNATNWTTAGDGTVILPAQLVGARSTILAAVGAASYLTTFTAAGASAVPGYFQITLTVPLPHPAVAGERYSLNMWSSKATVAGAPVFGAHEVHALWRDAANATLRDDLVGPVPALGGPASKKSVEPPVGATQVLMRAVLNLTSWNAGTIVRLFADATAVTVP